MKRFIEGEDRRQVLLLPDCLEDYVSDDNPVRVIEAFMDELDLKTLGFEGVVPETTGRPVSGGDQVGQWSGGAVRSRGGVITGHWLG